MRIDADVLHVALRHPNVLYPVKWKAPDAAFVRWLDAQNLPATLADFFRAAMPVKYAQLGSGGLSSPSEMKRANEERPTVRAAGLFIVGSMSNGDPVAVDLSNGTVGYVSHEELWGGQDRTDARKLFRWASPTLGAFVLGLVKRSLPMDYNWTWSEENLPRG